MAYEPLTTTGGNGYLGGNGTFPQLQAGLQWVAQNRDSKDQEHKTAWETAANTAEGNAKTYADGVGATALKRWGDTTRVYAGLLNDLTERGTWGSPSSGATANGWPTSVRSICTVFHWGDSAGDVIQLVIPRTEGPWYWRSRYAGTWSAWALLNPARQAPTGWVDISSGVGATVSSHGGLRIFRDGGTVWCIGSNVVFSTTGNHNAVAIPTGYRPASISGWNYRHEPAYSEDGASMRPTSYFSGSLRILDAQAGVPYTFAVSWPTTDAKIS
jgi:hypothetical protein